MLDLGANGILLHRQSPRVAHLRHRRQAVGQRQKLLRELLCVVQIVALGMGNFDFGSQFSPGAQDLALHRLCVLLGNVFLQITFTKPGQVLHQGVFGTTHLAGQQRGGLGAAFGNVHPFQAQLRVHQGTGRLHPLTGGLRFKTHAGQFRVLALDQAQQRLDAGTRQGIVRLRLRWQSQQHQHRQGGGR